MNQCPTEPVGQKLTYSELVEVLSKLAVRLDQLENVVVSYVEQFKVQDEFYVNELLKLGIDSLHRDKKTPYKTLMELKDEVSELNGAVHGIYEGRELKSSGRI